MDTKVEKVVKILDKSKKTISTMESWYWWRGTNAINQYRRSK